jgi:hypothetical protein
MVAEIYEALLAIDIVKLDYDSLLTSIIIILVLGLVSILTFIPFYFSFKKESESTINLFATIPSEILSSKEKFYA